MQFLQFRHENRLDAGEALTRGRKYSEDVSRETILIRRDVAIAAGT